MRRDKRGFNLVMYGLVIMVIVAAAFAVRHYWSGVLQHKYRQSGDSIGKGLQYERGRSGAEHSLRNTWEDEELGCQDVRDHVEDLENQKIEIGLLIEQLQREIEELNQRIEFLRQRAMDLEFQAARLEMAAQVEPGLSQQEREEMLANAAAMRVQAAELYVEADKIELERIRREGRIGELNIELGRIDNLILQIQMEFPECF